MVEHRNQVIPYMGNPEAPIVYIGQSPGEHEDKSGALWEGPAGEKLAEMLSGLDGVNIDSFFFLNAVACRPARFDDLKGRLENEAPTDVEIDTCKKWVHAAIRIVDPRCLILGGVSALKCVGVRSALGNVEGEMMDVKIRGVNREIVYAAMPVYHPSALARYADKPQLEYQTLGHMQAVIDRVKAYLRIARGGSPMALEER